MLNLLLLTLAQLGISQKTKMLKKMKKYSIYTKPASLLWLILFAFASGLFFQSCEDDETSGGKPVINYIRVTDPNKSDSLVSRAFLGNYVAIIGQDLQDVKEIWFNDQKAKLTTSLISSSSIIVAIPSAIPAKVTNLMMLVTRNNDTTKYSFNVDVPPPFIASMDCEYVKEGETAVINGNFFINDESSPLKVFFPGNIEGTVESVTVNQIKVKVPAGTGPGKISVKSIYGSSRSSFFFRDDRNIILDFDALTAAGGWRSGKIASSDPAGINGNFVRFSGNMAAGAGATWDEDNFSFNLWNSSNGRPNVPFVSDIANMCLKFECNVLSEWKSSALQMIFTPYSTSGTNGYIGDASVPRALWIPWKDSGKFKTDGWITVTVPLSDFKFTPTGLACANPLTKEMLGGLTFFVWSGGVEGAECSPNICIDNIRIVPL
jgi:hypothetical protein